MEKQCEICGTKFYFKPSHIDRARFCSKRCLGIANAKRLKATGVCFQKGLVPWSKTNAIGKHLSRATEFRKGIIPSNVLPVGSVTTRTDKNGLPRAWVKVASQRAWRLRAVLNWESIHGILPQGLVVHHKDRDSMNDSPENLVAMTRQQHASEHRNDTALARRKHRRAKIASASR